MSAVLEQDVRIGSQALRFADQTPPKVNPVPKPPAAMPTAAKPAPAPKPPPPKPPPAPIQAPEPKAAAKAQTAPQTASARPEVAPPTPPSKPKAAAAAQPPPPAPVRTPDVPKPPPAAVSPTLPKAAPKTPAAPPPESPLAEAPKPKTFFETLDDGGETPITIPVADLRATFGEIFAQLRRQNLPIPEIQLQPPQYTDKQKIIILKGSGQFKGKAVTLLLHVTNGSITIAEKSGFGFIENMALGAAGNIANLVIQNTNNMLRQTNITGFSVSPEGLTLQRKKK